MSLHNYSTILLEINVLSSRPNRKELVVVCLQLSLREGQEERYRICLICWYSDNF